MLNLDYSIKKEFPMENISLMSYNVVSLRYNNKVSADRWINQSMSIDASFMFDERSMPLS